MCPGLPCLFHNLTEEKADARIQNEINIEPRGAVPVFDIKRDITRRSGPFLDRAYNGPRIMEQSETPRYWGIFLLDTQSHFLLCSSLTGSFSFCFIIIHFLCIQKILFVKIVTHEVNHDFLSQACISVDRKKPPG